MKSLKAFYSPRLPDTLAYMLQSSEYEVGPYLKWYWRTKDFSSVMYRRTLDKTKAARLLAGFMTAGMLAQLSLGLGLLGAGVASANPGTMTVGLLLLLSYPIVWANLVALPLWLAAILIVGPRNRQKIARSEKVFANHPATKIAIAGSYGKTSMKEILNTMLSEGKKVAATPGNKNVSVSHAQFAAKLAGNEDVLLIEYGEGKPGDVGHFAKITHPSVGIITGLAPAHLDHYPSLQAAAQDIFSLATFVGDKNAYVNAESEAAKQYINASMNQYSSKGVLGWSVSDVKVDLSGTSFSMVKDKQIMKLKSALLGSHQVGPLALAVALGEKLGLTPEQIKAGIGNVAPYEHRMQPRAVRGAWIIDDSYNGNIDGMKAGLELLKALPGKRKTYVTPGLVGQGVETENVHQELGKLIAAASPNKVVLMQNSVMPIIKSSLESNGYKGELQIETDPLDFYTNIEHFTAAGDIIMLQNDWTDNYN